LSYNDQSMKLQTNEQLKPKRMDNSTHKNFSGNKLPARKMHRLIEYLDNVGLSPEEIASRAGIDLRQVLNASSNDTFPSIYYAKIYNEMVTELQSNGKHIPWAAGLGSDAFKMMCYSMISCKTLGEALIRAQKFNQLTYPLFGQQVKLIQTEKTTAVIEYDVDEASVRRSFSPSNWSIQECVSVARSSGIEMWLGLAGWLIGRKIEPSRITIAGEKLSDSYRARMRDVFQCIIGFDSSSTSLELPAELLDFRIVHDGESLEEFLDTGPYQLWSTEDKLVSTTAAIKSLLGNSFSGGMPSFEDMASSMHMSASTLRRHLLVEGSSYQKIKDERRRDIAIELLCLSDTKISDISEQIGFSDTSSFVRSFRTWTGLTPKGYRDSV